MIRATIMASLLAVTLTGSVLWAQPRTRAELTDYQETSRHTDVVEFLDRIAPLSSRLYVTHFGYSLEGRKLPLAVFGEVSSARPDAVRDSNRLRVFIQANIHAGEVCGKEAMQMLLRELALGEHPNWVESMVLLVAPIYNADGNERIRLGQRRFQNGPHGGMGQRPNAQGLDLNRDHMKLESPEARSLVRLMNEYDPHVAIDLHTTNGSHHGYHLTYSPPLNPNTHPAIDQLLRDRLLPSITDTIREEDQWEFYYYGNVPREGRGRVRGWYTFDHRPRFNNNYVGLRNRIGILSEAYSYATFRDRVRATHRFVEETLEFLHTRAQDIERLVETAESTPIVGTALALRAQFPENPSESTILMGGVERRTNPFDGNPYLERSDERTAENMPEFGYFVPTVTERVPWAYLVPNQPTSLQQLLSAHGIQFQSIGAGQRLTGQQFRVRTTQQRQREFQGHRERSVEGVYEEVEIEVTQGMVLVPMDQPLARLAFYLLEARSDDGFVNWNFLDDSIQEGGLLPIGRLMEEVPVSD